MLNYPNIDPVAIALGPVKIRWYGISYVAGILLAWWLLKQRAKKDGSGWNPEQVSEMIFYGTLGVIIGGRLGSVIFYNFSYYMSHPVDIFKVWQGGMSFHGGLAGVLVAMWFFGRHYQKGFFETTDFLAPVIPVGLFFGRIANFINGELWGRPTDVAWGMVFPHVDQLARHPSQLYQASLEGILLFILLWVYSAKARPRMQVSGLFLLAYGVLRFFAEFFREPDRQLGFIFSDVVTMGQLLSFPMIVIGLVLIIMANKNVKG